MGYERIAYDEQDTTGQMHDDCLVCASHMRLPHQAIIPESTALAVPQQRQHDPLPRTIEVDDATAHLASSLHLHLD